MSNVNAAATQWNLPNLIDLLTIVNKRTTFLNDVGGFNWGLAKSFQFVCGNLIDLEAAAQPAITETASLTAPTAWTYVGTQEYNNCQIYQQAVSLSYARLSDVGMLDDASTITVAGVPVNQDPKAIQQQAALRQIAANINYTFLNGAFQDATSAAVAWKTRGLITACSSNTVAAGSASFYAPHLEKLLETMAASGADFEDMAIYAGAFQINEIGREYGLAPLDRQVGGVAIERIVTPVCELAVRYDPFVPAGTMLVADKAKCRPIALPVPGKGVLFVEELTKAGAGEAEQIYGQIGLDYGSERYHGKITGLLTTAHKSGS
jgi:hypothetical protein